ncbi:glycosyltransferase family 32 protein [Flagellimonas sp.]|uniref:glycosyltransferase family 32 protein n=1 Tax=Flagellimonas sp. TaxID=2058762 RepID=UPI003F4A1FBD
MIPKIIHYCWLSGDEYPKDIKTNIASWKAMLPDYEFMLWDTNRFDISTSIWAQQAFENKKYAFASDLIRLHAVYTYGGIYLDMDVEVRKSFDDLLTLPYFIGTQFDNVLEAAVIGSEKGSNWILKCIQYYDDRPFIKENGSYDTKDLPRVMKLQLNGIKNIIIMQNSQVQQAQFLLKSEDSIYSFPFEYFSAKNYESGKISATKDTYTIHHFNSSWLPFFSRFRRKLRIIIGVNQTEKIISFLKLRKVLNLLYVLEKKWESK